MTEATPLAYEQITQEDHIREIAEANAERTAFTTDVDMAAAVELAVTVGLTLSASPAPSGQGVSGVDWAAVGRDYAAKALAGGIPQVRSPQYALSGAFTAMAQEIERLRAAPAPSCAPGEVAQSLDWTGGRAWPDLLEAIARYWAEWEEDRAGRGTYTDEELAQDGGEFATGLADFLAALYPQRLDAKEGATCPDASTHSPRPRG